MQLWSSDFWLVVTAASTLATVLATLLTLAVSAWWRKLDSQEADWTPHTASATWEPPHTHEDRSFPVAEFTLANAGDGTAFRMQTRGEHCTVTMGESRTGQLGSFRAQVAMLAAMHPGDDVRVWVECDPRLWEVAGVAISWRRSPTWRKRQSSRFATIPLSEIASRPVFGKDELDNKSGEYVRVPLPEPGQPPLSSEDLMALDRANRTRLRLPWRLG